MTLKQEVLGRKGKPPPHQSLLACPFRLQSVVLIVSLTLVIRLSSLAASGIPPSAVRSKLASLDTQAASSGTPRHSESFDPDTQRFLRQIQQRGKDAIATDSFNRVRNEFNTFLEDKIALSWEDQREKMFESLGLGHYKNNRPVNDMSKTGDYTAASALRSRSSVFGRSGLKKSVIGTPTSGPMGTHIFGDAAAAQSDPYPSNSRALREKMERYAAIVRNLNSARMQEKPYPILHELREIEHNPTDVSFGLSKIIILTQCS